MNTPRFPVNWLNSLSMLTLAGMLLSGCASTTVIRHPGPNDCGVRYYRPKPYLLVTPATGNNAQSVQIKLEYLPDFSEEYAIHIRSGLGANKTKITLDQGWNLTKIDYDVDARIPENIEAVAELIDKVGGILPSASRDSATNVQANNVPLGYYESVIGCGATGGKQLFGWRYVGFLPYAQCPTELSGYDCGQCQTEELFALVFEKGIMTFKPLSSAATMEPLPDNRPGLNGDNSDDESAAISETFRMQLTRALKNELQTELTPDDVVLRWQADRVHVSIGLTAENWQRLRDRHPGDEHFDLEIPWLPATRMVILATAEKHWNQSRRPIDWDVDFVLR